MCERREFSIMVTGVVVGVTHGLWHSEYDLKTPAVLFIAFVVHYLN